jgi:hypothetical protein
MAKKLYSYLTCTWTTAARTRNATSSSMSSSRSSLNHMRTSSLSAGTSLSGLSMVLMLCGTA